MSAWCFVQGFLFFALAAAIFIGLVALFSKILDIAVKGCPRWLGKLGITLAFAFLVLMLAAVSYQFGEQICKHGWNMAKWD